MIDSIGVEGAGPADNPMDLVAFAEEQLSQITAVLACNTSYQGAFHLNLACFRFGQLRLFFRHSRVGGNPVNKRKQHCK
jgi:hypothetical protein